MLELAKIYEGGKERGSDFTGIYLYVLKDTDKLKNFMTLDNYLSGPSELGATPPSNIERFQSGHRQIMPTTILLALPSHFQTFLQHCLNQRQ